MAEKKTYKKRSPKKTTAAKESPKAKKVRTFTATQAAKAHGVHRRYGLWLKKNHEGEYKSLIDWKAQFIQSGLLTEA